jgi:4-amino-4-deoxy-L-arabinose transferase-like glycosyltransferase
MKDYKVYAHYGSEGWVRDLFFLLLLFAVPFLSGLGRLPLTEPYEGRYAEISREMLERGDLVTPLLNYLKYFENQPLLYWINAASLKLFGLNEFAARFPSAICGLATLPATYMLARRLFDRRTALLSAIFLGTSAGFTLQSRTILTGTLLTLCMTVALGAFIVAARQELRPQCTTSAPWYLFHLFCSLAVLAGGMVGILLPAGIILIYLLLAGRWELLPRMRCGTGLLLFMAVAAPWFLMVWFRNPEFAYFFLNHAYVERFGFPMAGGRQSLWFLLPLLGVAMLPWSWYFPPALAKAWREQGREAGRSGLFLLIWGVSVLLFFPACGARQLSSLLPAFPPFAILTAHLVKGELERRGGGLKGSMHGLGVLLVVLGGGVLLYPLLFPVVTRLAEFAPTLAGGLKRFVEHLPVLSPFACLLVAALLFLQGVTALSVSGRRTGRVLIVLCLCCFVLEILVPRLIMGTIAAAASPRDLALTAAQQAGAGTPIVTVGPLYGVSWYARRRVLVAGKPDELAFGSRQGDQSAWFLTREALVALWCGGDPLLVILARQELDDLRPALHPVPRILMESGGRLLISNR